MAIQNIHKQAILKLINLFTTIKSRILDGQEMITTMVANQNVFKGPHKSFDLSTLTRLGYIISKFEDNFRPSSLVINGNASKVNNQNLIYFQQISVLSEFIESNSLYENPMQQSSSQHLQMLLLLIRDWVLQFYLNKNFIFELFPSNNANDGTTFVLLNLKENNIILISLLIFNIFYKLRNIFYEYNLLLEFSWICFTDLEPYIELANLDSEFIYNLLQSSLLSARIEEEQETQINSNLYKQIEMLNNKIIESKKRMLSLDVGKVSTQVSSNKPQLKIFHMDPTKSPIKIIQTTAESKFLPNITRQTLISSSSSKVFPSSSLPSNLDHHKPSNEIKRIERPFKCEVCLKSFPTSYKLNRHSYSHSGERPYLCSWPNCDKRFNDNYHLRRHMNTHTGEKPYPCKYPGCPKRYSRSEDLRNHQKAHFNDNATNTNLNSNTNNNQQSMSLSQNQQNQNQNHHQPTSSIHHHPHQQPPQSTNGGNLVLVQQTIMPPQSPAKPSSNHHPHQHHQPSHHRMTSTNTQSSQSSQSSEMIHNHLNQLQQIQQQQQQNYSSPASLHHHQEESSSLQPAIILQETISSPTNNQTNNHQQQPQQNTTNIHITENYF